MMQYQRRSVAKWGDKYFTGRRDYDRKEPMMNRVSECKKEQEQQEAKVKIGSLWRRDNNKFFIATKNGFTDLQTGDSQTNYKGPYPFCKYNFYTQVDCVTIRSQNND